MSFHLFMHLQNEKRGDTDSDTEGRRKEGREGGGREEGEKEEDSLEVY